MRRNWNESVDILVQYGMERAKATRLLRVGILEDPLTGNTLRNLDLLSAYRSGAVTETHEAARGL